MEALKSIGLIALVFLVLPVVILTIRDKIWHRSKRATSSEREVARKVWIERLRQARFDEVEKICGGLLPERLKLAYQQEEVILSEDVELNTPLANVEKHFYYVAAFVPLDADGQQGTAALSEFGRGCCFAGDGMGNFYWVPVGDTPQKDAPVYFACHDPYGNEKLATSVDEFLSWFPKVEKNSAKRLAD